MNISTLLIGVLTLFIARLQLSALRGVWTVPRSKVFRPRFMWWGHLHYYYSRQQDWERYRAMGTASGSMGQT